MLRVKTLILIKELPTDGHSPLHFICDDMESYYCKYRSGASLKPEEIDCLFYEIVAKKLLDKMSIPCPELAIVEIVPNSFEKKQLSKHKRFCVPGKLYFGSKGIPYAEDVHGLSSITNKHAFNKIINPYDILKIAMFDLWIDNCDRGKNENYNLLMAHEGNGRRFYAFDHAFCFGGLDALRIFNATRPISGSQKLITSSFFKNFLPYLNKAEAIKTIDNLLPLQDYEISEIINDSYEDCPNEWAIPDQLKERMILFLTDKDRLSEIKNLLWSLFT
jgi:hypothetical protein